MIGDWIRFGLCAVFMLAGLFIMVVSIIGLYRFDFALYRIHAAALEAGAGGGGAMADLAPEQPHAEHV